jgi:hypothetical protein
MKEVYLWKIGDKAIFHTDKEAASQIDGLTREPDMTVTQAEFEAAEGLARIIKGKIALGRTDQEKQIQTITNQISDLERQLDELDSKYLTPRILKGLSENDEYAVQSANTHEAKAVPLRKQREKLKIELECKSNVIAEYQGV